MRTILTEVRLAFGKIILKTVGFSYFYTHRKKDSTQMRLLLVLRIRIIIIAHSSETHPPPEGPPIIVS